MGLGNLLEQERIQQNAQNLAEDFLKVIKDVVNDFKFGAYNQLKLEHPELKGNVISAYIDQQGKLKFVVKDKRDHTKILTVKSVNGERVEGKEILKRLYLFDNVTIEFEEVAGKAKVEVDVSKIKSLGIKVKARKDGIGLVVTQVDKGSLAERLGLKKGDVLMGAVYTDSNRDQVQRRFQNERELILVMLQASTSFWGYKDFKLAVKPANMADREVFSGGKFKKQFLVDLSAEVTKANRP